MNLMTLTLENIHKKFDQEPVLKGIHLDIQQGEFLVLVGPSGCGKSTLLQIIAGLEECQQGTIRLGGKDITRTPPKDRNMAMVFQSYALYPNMTVEENLHFGLKLRKMDTVSRNRKVQEVAQLLQIDHLLKRKPSALSGGQRQRVAIGRALTRDPAVFLFDEPLSNLDAKLRVEMRVEIKKLHQKLKCSVVYVTHDQIEAMTLADRIAVMKDGEIQQLDTPNNVYHFPANKFVAEFMGSPSMNFLRVKIVPKEDECKLLLAPNDLEIPIQGPWKPRLPREFLHKDLLLGLRPEDITYQGQIRPECDGTFSAFESEIQLLEPTGPDFYAYCNFQGEGLLSRVTAERPLKKGETKTFWGNLTKAKFFDPETEKRIF